MSKRIKIEHSVEGVLSSRADAHREHKESGGTPCEQTMSANVRAFSVEALLGISTRKVKRTFADPKQEQIPIYVNQEGDRTTNDSTMQNQIQRTSVLKESVRSSHLLQPAFVSPNHSMNHTLPHQNLQRLPMESTSSPLIQDIKVELCGRDLWTEFHKLGNEMIITKAGRRMFPALKVKVSGLDPDAHYILWVDIISLDDNRYRYVYPSSQWMVAGAGDPAMPFNRYTHSDSPAAGRHWMMQFISFDRLKLTNNKQPVLKGQVSLHSMHKYQPRIHIQRINDLQTEEELQLDINQSATFVFHETSFITVTAYQNQQITRLKIASNPFAKGFRESAKSRDDADIFEHNGSLLHVDYQNMSSMLLPPSHSSLYTSSPYPPCNPYYIRNYDIYRSVFHPYYLMNSGPPSLPAKLVKFNRANTTVTFPVLNDGFSTVQNSSEDYTTGLNHNSSLFNQFSPKSSPSTFYSSRPCSPSVRSDSSGEVYSRPPSSTYQAYQSSEYPSRDIKLG